MAVPAQRSFAGGEVAPALYARTDQSKYATGLRTCRNMIVRRHGGATNRAGTRFIQESKNSAVTGRLIRFVRDGTSLGDTYLIELGSGYARFYQNGGAIVTAGVAAWVTATAYTVGDLVTQGGVTYYCILAHNSATGTDKPGVDAGFAAKWYAQTGTIYEIPTPFATADLADLQLTQKGDVITFTHQTYGLRELKRYAHTRWTLSSVAFGPSIAAPTNVAATGGGAGTIRYWAVTAIKAGSLEESLAGLYSSIDKVPSAGSPVALTWDAVAGAISYNVYRSTDGQTYGLISSAGGNPIDSSDTTWTDSNETASSSTSGGFRAAAGQCRNALAAISATVRAYDGKYTIAFAFTLTGGGDGSSLVTGDPTQTLGRVSAYYSRDAEARVLAGTSDLYTVEGVQVMSGSGQFTIDVPDNGYAALTIDLVPEVQPTVDGQVCTMNIDTSTSAITWKGGASGFSDGGDVPDYSIAPPSEPTLFGAGAYPAAITNFQQRRVLANTPGSPDTVWASRIGSPTSFAKSTPLQTDDLVQFALESDETQAVKHLLDIGRLLAFTSAGVFQCGSAEDGSITPTTPNPRSIDSNGVGRIRPLRVSDSVLFVETTQTAVRDLQPWQAGGSLGGYSGKDLTVFAAHLFDGYTIVDWAFAKKPHSIVWVVRSDGVLLGLTYLREHEIWGWHRHDTDGVVENVCVIPEGSEDAVYLLVRRTINGATKRYVERLASRFFTAAEDAFFVDCGLSYDGRNTNPAIAMTLSGSSSWASTERVTATCTGGTPFVAANVGDSLVFTASDGSRVEVVIEAYTSASVVLGRPTRSIPVELQGAATSTWTLAVAKVAGLAHLEGKAVSVLGDGFVDASPNNAKYPVRTVSGGQLALGRAYGVIHVGLPFISDLETLDLDSPGPRSLKDKKTLINSVAVFVEASRGIWAGRSARVTDDAPLAGLQEQKPRSTETYTAAPSARTEFFEITIDSSWDNNGGVLVRQVDPIPMTILAAMPGGFGITGD